MPDFSILTALILLGAYLIGSLSSAIILCKIVGLPDPRSSGSGNPGATNVLRIAGKKLAATVLIIDVLKGFIPVLIAKIMGLSPEWIAATAFFAFIGHLYPVFFQFKGGKGVATALGAFLALSPLLALAGIITWLIVFKLTKISSLSALSAAALIPLYSLWALEGPVVRGVILIMSTMLIWRHRSNIQRLLAGDEKKS